MVRNDISQANNSPGYMVFGEKGNGETEFMHDAAGNGQVNNDRRARRRPAAAPAASRTGSRCRRRTRCSPSGARATAPTWTQVGVPDRDPVRGRTRRTSACSWSRTSPARSATAEFSDWSLTEIDRARTRSRSDPAPACAPRESDEFDGAAVNAARWTTVRGTPDGGRRQRRRSRSPTATSTGPTPGAISYLGQPAPAGAWTATTKVTLDAGQRVAVRRPAPARRRRQLLEGGVHEALERLAVLRVLVGDRRQPRRATAATSTVPAATGTTVYVRLDARAARS